MPTLIDTSAWVDLLRGSKHGAAARIEALVAAGEVRHCGIVELELLSGVKEAERDSLLDDLSGIPFVATERADFVLAGDLRRRLASKGRIVSPADSLLAALCLGRGFSLLTLDGDFRHFPGLKLEAH